MTAGVRTIRSAARVSCATAPTIFGWKIRRWKASAASHVLTPPLSLPQEFRSLINDEILDNMDGLTVIGTFFVVVLIAAMVYGVYIVFGLPEDDRPTFEWFGKSEPWAPPTRTSPRRQELKPNTYFGM